MRRALAGFAVAVMAIIGAGGAAHAADDSNDIVVTVPNVSGGTDVRQAQLRWGINEEVGGGAFAGGCNFLSAGVAGSTGSSRVWRESDGFFRASEGNTTVIRPVAGGEWEPLTWNTKCTDPWGSQVTSAGVTVTGVQVVMSNGVGKVYSDGRVNLQWTGSFTIAFYGGMTYWSVSNPTLTLDKNGNGQLMATASGYGADRDDASRWITLPAQPIVLADIRGADAASRGFVVVPEYVGVTTAGQVPKTQANASYWGSFPESFVAFQRLTGQAAYWFTSGGARDVHKPTTPLYINYDPATPAVTPPVVSPTKPTTQPQPSNPVKTRPGTSAAAAVAAAAAPAAPAAKAEVKRGAVPAALTSLPAPTTLIPGLADTSNPMSAPLLGLILAVLVGALAVLSMFEQLPWQRRGRAKA